MEIPIAKNRLTGSGNAAPKGYVPPLVSNGSISMQLDWTGSQRGSYCGIWRAGRRYPNPGAALIPFGWLEQRLTLNGQPVTENSWSQSLHVQEGFLASTCNYESLTQELTILTPLDSDVIAVRHRITSQADEPQTVRLSLIHHLCPINLKEGLPDKMAGNWSWNAEKETAEFSYKVYGHPTSTGLIALFASAPVTCDIKSETATLNAEFTLNQNETKDVVFYLALGDSIDGETYTKTVSQLQENIKASSFDTLLSQNTQAWKEYLTQSSVDIPDESIQRMYNTAQYHLRVNATRWSFPVGISPWLWNGRYFGWDEMFCHQGLVTSNHLEIARRCPDFRKAILKVATYRVGHYGRPGIYGAKYVWEAMEDGSEGAPPGFWNDHIFNMSNVARSAWTQYLYSNDLDWLKSTGFPVILECARYFKSHWVYEDSNGELYIGKCTDLERLGPARDRPFMTTCGAIYALRSAADAAELVQQSTDETKEMRSMADKLIESLPQRDGAYIGYKNCQEATVATLGGLFPYDIFDASNPLQKKAAYLFITEGRKNGNMYPVGNGVCPWYAGKMAAAMAILEDKTEPVKLMREAAASIGNFGELYEINEPALVSNPWFTTAAGNCVYAVNQMLIHCKNNEIVLLGGVPGDWSDFSFRLPAYGGVLVEVTVRGGKITRLSFHANGAEREIQKVVSLPASYLEKITIQNPALMETKQSDGKIFLTLRFHGDVTLIPSEQ